MGSIWMVELDGRMGRRSFGLHQGHAQHVAEINLKLSGPESVQLHPHVRSVKIELKDLGNPRSFRASRDDFGLYRVAHDARARAGDARMERARAIVRRRTRRA